MGTTIIAAGPTPAPRILTDAEFDAAAAAMIEHLAGEPPAGKHSTTSRPAPFTAGELRARLGAPAWEPTLAQHRYARAGELGVFA